MAEHKKKPVSVWEQALRRTLKAEHGKGWSLRESRGRAQLVQILEDRSRRSTKLDIIWASKNARLMLEAVAQLREYLDGGMPRACGMKIPSPVAEQSDLGLASSAARN